MMLEQLVFWLATGSVGLLIIIVLLMLWALWQR
jgi:hypothetical protein